MKLQHPDSKQTIDVPADRVAVYETQGWREAPAETPAPKKPREN